MQTLVSQRLPRLVLPPPCPAPPCAGYPWLCGHPCHPQAHSPTRKLWPGRAASASRSGVGSTATRAPPARRAASCASNCMDWDWGGSRCEGLAHLQHKGPGFAS